MRCYSCRKYDNCELPWKCSSTMYDCSAYELEQTNEEFMRSTTTEEFAGAIYEWYSLGYTRGKNGKKLNPITEVVEWLKEIHHDGDT